MQLPPGVDGSVDIPAEALDDGETVDDDCEDVEVFELNDGQGDEVIGASEENE